MCIYIYNYIYTHIYICIYICISQISSIGRLFFNRPVDFSRSISTVDVDSPTWKYCWYRQSMQIHLFENTVDINGRYRFACLKIRSILHGPSISEKNWSKSTVTVDSYQQKSVDCVFPKSQKKRTIDLWSQRWWEMVPDTHPPKSHGPCVVRNGPNTYPNIDTYPLIYRPGRLVTVDIDGRCRLNNGKIWSISTVDTNSPTENYSRSSIKINIILWSISSTTPVMYI